ncbi:hypothetical protein FACS1894218_5070 [Bacilli bacterium]|nr:hypothetical protein FACS1894218_5070 [Bacilli bacterium]
MPLTLCNKPTPTDVIIRGKDSFITVDASIEEQYTLIQVPNNSKPIVDGK